MQPLTSKEIRKRGCEWCLDHRWHRFYGCAKKSHACIHDQCPYCELDKYDKYDQYLKHSHNDGIEKLLDAVFILQRDL